MTIQRFGSFSELEQAANGLVRIEPDGIDILNEGAVRGEFIDRLAWTSAFGETDVRDASRWLIRHLAEASGAWTASIHDLYRAAGRNEYANATTPAINLRMIAYDLAQTVFQAARETGTRQILFELARSEMGYTAQRPGEYASSVLAAAVKEGWKGPVFIQGDHYQASLRAWGKDPAAELDAVRSLTLEALAAGYGNIDIDSSTLVDLSRDGLRHQQEPNYVTTAILTKAIRDAEPDGVTISIGGEIGEVGLQNSTVDDLDAFMEGYLEELARLGRATGRTYTGISKISVQTGTSHGGVVLPDGSIKEVSVDFGTLAELSEVAKRKYGLGGAVQHGASTLPESAFSQFADANAVEVHLATAFQSAIFDADAFPDDLRAMMYAYLDATHADERKDGMTDAQFYYTARKRAIGPFKREVWSLESGRKGEILDELRGRFALIMRELGVAGRGELVDRLVPRVPFPIVRDEGVIELASVDLGDEGE